MTSTSSLHLSPESYAARAGDRVGSGDRLAHEVARGDRLGAEPQDTGMDAGELEQVVDHPDHPVDLGPHLPVVARRVVGEPVLERLGHRPEPGQRGAQVVRDPRHQLAARLPPARARVPARLGAAARWCGAARSETAANSAAPCAGGERAALTEPPGRRRAARATDRASAAPTPARRRAPRPRRRRPPTDHHARSWFEQEHRTRRGHGARHHRDHGRRRDHDRQPAQRARRISQPDQQTSRSRRQRDQAAAISDDRRPGRASSARPPTGSRRPTPSRAGVGSVGSPSTFSRSRRTCTVTVDWSPNDQPHTCSSSWSRSNDSPGWRDQEGEQVELARRQREPAPAEGRAVRGHVHHEVTVATAASRTPAPLAARGAAPRRPAGPARAG